MLGAEEDAVGSNDIIGRHKLAHEQARSLESWQWRLLSITDLAI